MESFQARRLSFSVAETRAARYSERLWKRLTGAGGPPEGVKSNRLAPHGLFQREIYPENRTSLGSKVGSWRQWEVPCVKQW
jgi:hypothetical protein